MTDMAEGMCEKIKTIEEEESMSFFGFPTPSRTSFETLVRDAVSRVPRKVGVPNYKSVLTFLKPELISVLTGQHKPTKIHATSWADGLRGYASMGVMLWHYTLPYYPNLNYGYGANEASHWFTQLPIIRLPYTAGLGSVTLFFVL